MKLIHLHAKNVFSIGEINLPLKDLGLTLVTGWSYDENNGNMAGKSSTANRAIVWGLYGKTVDGIRADDVINTSSGIPSCSVTIDFEGVDGRVYTVVRKRQPNDLRLYVDGQDLSRRLDKETQGLIDRALGRDHKTFIQSDFFGQGREQSFLSLPGSEQRLVIEEILPVNSLTQWYENSKTRLAELDAELEVAKTSLMEASVKATTTANLLASVNDQQKLWRTNHTVEVSRLQMALSRIQTDTDLIKKEIQELSMSIPADMSVEEVKSKEEKKQTEFNQELTTIQHVFNGLIQEIDYRKSKPESCKECGQKLPDELMAKNDTLLAAKTIETDKLIKRRTEVLALLYNVHATIAICNEIVKLKNKLREADVRHLQEAELARKKAEVCPFDNLATSYVKELDNLLLLKVGKTEELESIKKRKAHYEFWENAFGKDLKTLLFEKVCPYLETRANTYLKELNNGQIKVSFSTNKELKSGDTRDQFCVTARSTTGSSMFELFSGAEKQLTSFAVGLALSDLASLQAEGASQFMILDEPFLYQSPENCENIINFITQKLGSKKSTILLISNEDNLVNLVPNKVHVVKRNGVSSLEAT